MKKINQNSKKLTLNRKVVILLTNTQQAQLRAGSAFSLLDNCKSTTPGTCASADCTTVPTAGCV